MKPNKFEVLPFDKDKEISGYIEPEGIYFIDGEENSSQGFADKSVVFHTHPDKENVNADIVSEKDIINFLFSENKVSIILSQRLIIILTRTAKTFNVDSLLDNPQHLMAVDELRNSPIDLLEYFTCKDLTTQEYEKNYIQIVKSLGIDIAIVKRKNEIT